eukprot:4865988-Pyramimonas_sp.AAC.1
MQCVWAPCTCTSQAVLAPIYLRGFRVSHLGADEPIVLMAKHRKQHATALHDVDPTNPQHRAPLAQFKLAWKTIQMGRAAISKIGSVHLESIGAAMGTWSIWRLGFGFHLSPSHSSCCWCPLLFLLLNIRQNPTCEMRSNCPVRRR